MTYDDQDEPPRDDAVCQGLASRMSYLPAMNHLPATPYETTRARFGLTQAEWARALGVARSTVSAWERGVAAPPPVLQFAIRLLQERILMGSAEEITRLRTRLLEFGAEARAAAERLNRRAGVAPAVGTVLAVTAAGTALGLLLSELVRGARR